MGVLLKLRIEKDGILSKDKYWSIDGEEIEPGSKIIVLNEFKETHGRFEVDSTGKAFLSPDNLPLREGMMVKFNR